MSYPCISSRELSRYGKVETCAERLRALMRQQCDHWSVCARGFGALGGVKRRELEVCGDRVIVQWNPGRIRSAAADLDPAAVAARPCFLCAANLPAEQRALDLGAGWVALCNPFPIFDEHFTIAAQEHRPQDLRGAAAELLELAREVGGTWAVIFNGAKAGASAPDHMHFQACPAPELPLLSAVGDRKRAEDSWQGWSAARFFGVDYLILESEDRDAAAAGIEAFVAACAAAIGDAGLMNLIVHYRAGAWRAVAVPRRTHRPRCYYEADPARLLISPAAVELAGVVVLPRREDFERIDGSALAAVFSEVALDYRCLGLPV